MGTVHDLLEARGKQGTLALDFDRSTVEAAAAYLADEDASVGYLFSGWTQAALPHKKLADDHVWEIRTERLPTLAGEKTDKKTLRTSFPTSRPAGEGSR